MWTTTTAALRRGALLALALPAALAPAAPAWGSYVALGDSYAAGPGIPTAVGPLGCLRSSGNYPRLAAAELGLELRDASCSGARTTHMTAPQDVFAGGPNAPQLDRLDAGTRIVSITIGGNDIGFTEIVRSCVAWSPLASPCRDRHLAGGVDRIARRIAAAAPALDAVLGAIRARSPRARLLIVNYPAVLPATAEGCRPWMPVSSADLPYLRAKLLELNAMLAAQAAANGAELVDWHAASLGHDACRRGRARWVEPLLPGDWAAPVHPNGRGMRAAADALVAAVRGR